MYSTVRVEALRVDVTLSWNYYEGSDMKITAHSKEAQELLGFEVYFFGYKAGKTHMEQCIHNELIIHQERM